jgi:hypothetical protein
MGRAEWFEPLGSRTLTLTPLDALLDDVLTEIHMLKIDTQGTELDILRSGTKVLEHVLCIRIEVEFAAVYDQQALFSDVDAFLRDRDFQFWGLCESHSWRHRPGLGCTGISPEGIWWSRGRLIHGDAVYFRNLDPVIGNKTSALRTALIALCYGFVDDALLLLRHSGVWTERFAPANGSLEHEIDVVSKRLHTRQLINEGRQLVRGARDVVRAHIRRIRRTRRRKRSDK